MSELSPQDNGAVPLELSGIEKARELANTITLNRITSKVNENPAVDLSDLLKQLPQLRETLVQKACRRVTACSPKEEPISKDSSRSSAAQLHGSLIQGDVEITHPIDQRILEHAGIQSVGTESPSTDIHIITGLNHELRTSQVLWNLHSSFILSLGRCEVVKTGMSLDPDGITNLQYINTRVPEIPTPSFLGSLIPNLRPKDILLHVTSKRLDSRERMAIPHHRQQTDREITQRIGSFISRTCKDARRSQRTSTVPIHTEAEFNDFLCHEPNRTVTPWKRMIRSAMGEPHQLVRTHGDLHPRNIMVAWERDDVRGDGEKGIRVTSVLDWEMGGWYPEYWGFVKALSTVSSRGAMADWGEYLPSEAIGVWPVD
ncbi:hypothetical protein VE03_06194 [Pseudogymnoascus sp. 23342-1-I1]|nr:hypothetical protein VE03_06194 [Pseudogymnoascus sp. 23342-1-I1]